MPQAPVGLVRARGRAAGSPAKVDVLYFARSAIAALVAKPGKTIAAYALEPRWGRFGRAFRGPNVVQLEDQ